jgi:hypothetical protein
MNQSENEPEPAAPWSKRACEELHEIVQDLINSVEAICSRQVYAEERKPNPDRALIKFWTDEEYRLYDERHNLDPHDEAEIRRLDALYTPVVRYKWKEVKRCRDKENRSWDGDPPIWFGVERWLAEHGKEIEASAWWPGFS